MTQNAPRRWITVTNIVIALFSVIALGFIVHLLWLNTLQSAREIFLKEQIEVFNECRTQAQASNPTVAAGYLEYVAHYYPSGTKQETGSPLDWAVERERQRAIADIIALLAQKTGDNLGPNPDPWIKKYAHHD